MQVLNFKDFIDYNKRIGKMIITGVEGSGKTMLLARIAIGKMLNGVQDCWKSYDVVDEYNSLGFEFSKEYEHLSFCNFEVNCAGTRVPNLSSYWANPYRLGLFDPMYETDFYPPYACFCFMEAYNFLNSYLYDMFRESFKAWLKTCRQAKYDIVIDAHSVGDICTIFKKITNRFIYLFKEVEEIKNLDGIVIGHKMFVCEWNNYRDVELYERSGKKQNCLEYELIIDKCMYENYDTNFCKWLHLEGREYQDFNISHFNKVESVDDLNGVGEKFGITPPEGFFVSRGKRQQSRNVQPIMPSEEEMEDLDF